MGAMVSPEHTSRVMSYIERGKLTARLVAGGSQVQVNGSRNFIQPTIFDDVDPADALGSAKKSSGRCCLVITFDTEEEAISIANDSIYGLGASIWTDNIHRALRVAPRIRAGTVSVNAVDMFSVLTPFGGFKQTGHTHLSLRFRQMHRVEDDLIRY